jgi:signal transduction histidine kinase/ligand-binding sensor domain-containing protein
MISYHREIIFRGNRAPRRNSRSGATWPAAVAAVLLAAPQAFPVNPELALRQYLHTSWTQEEGSDLPPVQALAQTADGYLWLGTGKGLIRFDGQRFADWQPFAGDALPGSDIRFLRPSKDGGLWVGALTGLCKLERGRVVFHPATRKLPCALIHSMIEADAGRLWILSDCSTGNALSLLSRDGSLKTLSRADGLPEQRLLNVLADRSPNLWIGVGGGICRWSPGSAALCSPGHALAGVSLVEESAGNLLIADNASKQVLRYRDGRTDPIAPAIPGASFVRGAMLRDRDGNVWLGTTGQGLLRIRGGKVDRLTAEDGLSSNLVNAIVEDSEGDVWVATARGIDRFRDPKFLHVTTREGLSGDLINAVYGASDGATWVGTVGGGLNRVDGTRVTQAAGLPRNIVASLFEDSGRQLWVGTTGGLVTGMNNRFAEVRTNTGQPLTLVCNISGNADGIWLADGKQGLFRVRGRTAHPVAVPSVEGANIYRLLAARSGAVWLGRYKGGGVTVINGDQVQHYSAADGLARGPVLSLYEDRAGAIWVGAEEGLSRFRDGRWTTWTKAQSLPEGGVLGIVEDDGDGLWLLTPAGILRLARPALNGSARALTYSLYGRTEGLRLAASGSMSTPRLTKGSNGHLWFCTQDGVAEIDPARVRSNPVAPPVHIEQVSVDGKAFDPGAQEIAFRGSDLRIEYTGVSLMAPERVRFRYRIRERDRDWTDAGPRRTVTYVNLPPGSYRFQVIAANNDGIWNNTGAEVALRIIPYFYQTTWFAAACLTSALLAAWGVHWAKVRRVVERFQLIAAERARFSRELHDSILQGFSGVVYQLEAAARQFESAPEASRQRLEKALDQADRSCREARELITSMRIPALENSTLPDALRATAAPMVSGLDIDFQFDVKGSARQAHYDIEANIFLLAREALTNSINHSGATRIRMELQYTGKALRLTVQDNGSGFDPDAAANKTGHWGFRGMKESARQIGAEFSVDTAPGKGATITVTIPWKQ